MMKETLSQTNILEGPLFALILFVLVFLLVTVRVLMRGKNDPRALHLASLPLLDDDAQTTQHGHHEEDGR